MAHQYNPDVNGGTHFRGKAFNNGKEYRIFDERRVDSMVYVQEGTGKTFDHFGPDAFYAPYSAFGRIKWNDGRGTSYPKGVELAKKFGDYDETAMVVDGQFVA